MSVKTRYGGGVDADKKRDVIPSLMDVLSEAVERANKDHVDIRPLTTGLGRGGQRLSEKQLRRYLEERDPPTGSKIDQWARVIATATGERDYLVYWDEAVERAKGGGSGEPGERRRPPRPR